MMAPAYEQAARVLEPHVRLAKVNTEEQQALASRFGIVSIPTLIVFKGGREVARQPGALSQPDIVRWVRAHV
jgi:thioredoxin 2